MQIKPCLFNCVVYCRQKERVDYCLDLMHTLSGYFPCRLFFIHHLEEGHGHYTQSREIPHGQMTDFYDTLFVEASSDQLHRVSFSLFPFLVPELPIMLFWDCDPTQEKDVLPAIYPYANRLIFDSETIEDFASFANRMLATPEREACARIDLNWVRLIGWRELLAKVFDTPERVEQLRAASEIQISYNARENRFFHHSQMQARYLQAWLASQMGWEYKETHVDVERIQLRYQADGHPLQVTMQPLYIEQRLPGSVIGMEVTSRLGTQVMMDSRSLIEGVRVKSICDASCTLPYTLPLRGSRLNNRFFQQLLYQEVNEHYHAMLHMLAKQK